MSRRAAAGVAALVVLLASACGGEPSVDDYCGRLAEDREQIADILSAGDAGGLLDNVALFDQLRQDSPRDLRDEWDTLVTALEELRTALDDAGVEPDDFEGGEPPASLTGQQRRAVVAAADRVADPDVVAAASGIETQARDVCKINLGL